jgi:hypothetical protein
MEELSSARARGRISGSRQGLTKQANEKACAAEALYRQGELTSEKIAQQLGI